MSNTNENKTVNSSTHITNENTQSQNNTGKYLIYFKLFIY